MPGNVTISQAGEHSGLADTDRIPASRGPFTPGARGYIQYGTIRAAVLAAINAATSVVAAGIPTAYTSTPPNIAATGSAGASTQWAKGDHTHALGISISTPSRTLNSAGFQPSTTKDVLVCYSVRILCTSTIAGGQNGKIELMSDSNSTPTTVRGTIQNRNSVSIAIALTAENEQTAQLTHLVPAGHYVRLISTATLGSPSFSIISQTEIALG